jgi:lipopolysaccharide transport system permease protein
VYGRDKLRLPSLDFGTTSLVNYLLQKRQAWSVVLDAVIAATTCLVAHQLRFFANAPAGSLQGSWTAIGVVVAAVVAGCWLAGVYRERPIQQKVKRLVAGSALGMAAAIGISAVSGSESVSRSAILSAWFLFVMAAIAWRTIRVLFATRVSLAAAGGDLVDRTGDHTTMAETVWALVTYRELIRNLVLKDLKLKYRGSVLGFLWSLINPVALLLVYTLAFKIIMRHPQPDFLLYLLIGILAWTFFAGSLTMAAGSIVDAGSLMKAVRFPRAILPLASVFFNLVQYLLTVVVLLPILLAAYGVMPTATMLLFPVFLTLQVLFIAGLALMVAAATAFFRDVKHLLDISLSLLFWTTPIVYPLAQLSQASERAQALLMFSPMSPFVLAYHDLFYHRQWPDLSLWVITVSYAVTSAAVGLALFLSVEDRLSERL